MFPTANSPDSFTTSALSYSATGSTKSEESSDDEKQYSPWNHPGLAERAKTNKQAFRSRQHVNPLAKKFQQPTTISKSWPRDVFEDLSKPMFLDIGCSRGGFLIDMANRHPNDYNYLGLEIRPIVVYHAKERIEKHNLKGVLDFVGCNANIDLERLLTLLTTTEAHENWGDLKMVTIQFPDPHFKARHAKRRVVTPELVKTLARFMPAGATVFLQSDVQSVLDEMRLQFREQFEYFEDTHKKVEQYIPENIVGVPTEREISVLERNLPVYRATFKRTNVVTPAN
jgi:tRNA (guanine-N7-)-methyltransferase